MWEGGKYKKLLKHKKLKEVKQRFSDEEVGGECWVRKISFSANPGDGGKLCAGSQYN